jgi:hypothetical protein
MTGRMTRRRYRGARRVVASLHAAAIALMLWAVPAAAVNVTVAATTYDISFAGFGRTFLDDETAIRATPWWGNETLATAVANAYLDQVGVGGSPFTDDMRQNTTLNFAYAIGNVGGFDVVRFSQLTEGSPPLITTGGFQEQDIATSFSVFAILGAPAVPVPEINAGALAQALFCLMALQLWIVLRRRRVHAQQGRRVQP